MSSLSQIEIIRPGALSPRAFDFFSNLEFDGQLGSAAVRLGHPDHGDWRFTWLLPMPLPPSHIIAHIAVQAAANDIGAEADLHASDIALKDIAEINWLQHSYRSFAPFQVGRFYLYGQHHADTPPPTGTIPLQIDAVTAFGSGEHPTTRGCLLWLDALQQDGALPHRVLDMGTGTGILAIAAYKLWGCPVVAADIDREAVKVACEYRTYNHVPAGANGMICKQAANPALPAIRDRGPYDLIVANILAPPLKSMAADLALVASPHATLIISGVLDTQLDDVVAYYTPHGFTLDGVKQIDDWVAARLVR